MKKIPVMLCLLLVTGSSAYAQRFLKNMANRAENAATNKAGNAVEKTVNQGADEILNGPKKKEEPAPQKSPGAAEDKSTPATKSAYTPVQAYSKFDFVAGEQVLIADDFSQDAIGEFAMHWNTNNKGEVVAMKDNTKWLKLSQAGTYTTPNSKMLPENFTMEFDMILDMQTKGYLFPEMTFTLFNSGAESPTGNTVFKKFHENKAVQLNFFLAQGNNTRSTLTTYAKHYETFKSAVQTVKVLEDNYGKPVHFAISVQKTRFRMWINEQKVYDMPKIIDDQFNQLAIAISSSNYKDDELGFYISNFKLATGYPDVRAKLLTEGKFSTTGITFDVNSDVIKPSSLGVIKEIGTALQSDPSVKVRITGHTDSDGAKAANETLSKKRAEAVKKALADIHGIAQDRITTEGKGAAVPVAENTSPEGKAKNRRVEFEKL